MEADGRKPPTDDRFPTGTDTQLHSVGQSKQTRNGAWSTGNTKWQGKWIAMTGTICTTMETNNPTVKDRHNKRHQHTLTPHRHVMAIQICKQRNGHSGNPNTNASDHMQIPTRGKGTNKATSADVGATVTPSTARNNGATTVRNKEEGTTNRKMQPTMDVKVAFNPQTHIPRCYSHAAACTLPPPPPSPLNFSVGG